MGYYSDLTVMVTEGVKSFDEVERTARELAKDIDWEREGEEEEFKLYSNAKWYDHREFAKHLSSCFQDTEFQIHRLGEGVNEEWDEERYKVKEGEIYDEEVMEVKWEWKRRTEEDKQAAEKLNELIKELRSRVGRGE